MNNGQLEAIQARYDAVHETGSSEAAFLSVTDIPLLLDALKTNKAQISIIEALEKALRMASHSNCCFACIFSDGDEFHSPACGKCIIAEVDCWQFDEARFSKDCG